MPVDGILAIVGKEGEDYKPLLEEGGGKGSTAEEKPSKKSDVSAEAPSKTEKEKSEEKTAQPATQQKPTTKEKPAAPAKAPAAEGEAKRPEPTTKRVSPAEASAEAGRIKVSPLAKKLSSEKGIDLSTVAGTGEHGRIVKRDIDWYKEPVFAMATPGKPVATPTFTEEDYTKMLTGITEESSEELPVSQMRKTIARRLVESKFTAPHFYLTMEIDMDNAVQARESINATGSAKISFNDFVIKAAALALKLHPNVNASWGEEKIIRNHHIHIGVAVAVDEGLLVPVVRFADTKTLSEINAEVKDFAGRAKNKKLQPADWQGNTFTVSNLGMFGIEEFTAIINPPDSCILAIGTVMHKPVIKNGQILPGNIMKVTLSCDHRVVDGATGARFLQTFKSLMENPVVMLGMGNL
jgi:pyruvate dehydrogenase E2 component (dihydrolipoamide acetyltransferase)